MEVFGDNWSCRTFYRQSTGQIVSTGIPTPGFLQAGCPSCPRTNSAKAVKGTTITFHGLAPLGLTWRSVIRVLTSKGSWLLRETVTNPLVSPLTPIPRSHDGRNYLKLGANFLNRMLFTREFISWIFKPHDRDGLLPLLSSCNCHWSFLLYICSILIIIIIITVIVVVISE